MEAQMEAQGRANKYKNLKPKEPLPQNAGKGEEVRRLLALNWTNAEIIKETGCSSTFVSGLKYKIKMLAQSIATSEKAKMKPKARRIRVAKVLPSNVGKHDIVVRMLNEDMHPVDIAKSTGCTVKYAARLLWGMQRDARNNAGKKPKAPKVLRPDEVQVGGNHYKDNKIQVWDAIHDWGLGYFSGNVIKYVARHQKKSGLEDLKKARHYLDKLIAVWEAKTK